MGHSTGSKGPLSIQRVQGQALHFDCRNFKRVTGVAKAAAELIDEVAGVEPEPAELADLAEVMGFMGDEGQAARCRWIELASAEADERGDGRSAHADKRG